MDWALADTGTVMQDASDPAQRLVSSLRDRFLEADMGISGANIAVAEVDHVISACPTCTPP